MLFEQVMITKIKIERMLNVYTAGVRRSERAIWWKDGVLFDFKSWKCTLVMREAAKVKVGDAKNLLRAKKQEKQD